MIKEKPDRFPAPQIKWKHIKGKPYEQFFKGFQMHANSLAMYFGGPVYLVGSALVETRPRDHDVRVVIGEQDRDRLFGEINGTTVLTNQWCRAIWEQHYEGLKQSRALQGFASMWRIDLQVQSEAQARRHFAKERLRLDASPDKWLGVDWSHTKDWK